MNILAFNAGSSSIKFALYPMDAPERALFSGSLDRIGDARATLSITRDGTTTDDVAAPDFAAASEIVFAAIAEQAGDATIDAIAHRIVYGAAFENHVRIDELTLDTLRAATGYDPDHLPQALSIIDECRRLDPSMPQIACFDTVFHRTMPEHARLTPLTRPLIEAGAVRHGFHGLSYQYLIESLAEQDRQLAHGRVIIAHLGSGASVTALDDMKSVETSMGFSPTGGIIMGTRSGDIDPGLFLFLADQGLGIEAIDTLLTKQSGLLGISGTSPHMITLLEKEHEDEHAAQAIRMFVHSVRKCIGSYAAILNGVDAIVFSGGIGEHSAPIRARVCETLSYLGVHIDTARNARNERYISSDGALPIFVFHTDEQQMMVRIARDILRA